MSHPWSRGLALAGVVWVLMVVLANDVLGGASALPGPGEPASAFAEYYSSEIDALSWVAVATELAGMGFGLLFIGFVAVRLREAGSFGAIAGIAGAVALAIKMGSGAPVFTAMYRGDQGLSPEILKTLTDINGFAFVIGFLPLGVFAIASSLGMLSAKIVPAWVSWSGIVSGIALFLAMPFALDGPGALGMVIFLLWTIVSSVALALGAAPMETTRTIRTSDAQPALT